MVLKRLLQKLIYGAKADSDSYVQYLRKMGVRIGNNCVIYAPTKTQIDTTRPWLIRVGDDVRITEGVTILTHGFDWSVLQGMYGEVLGSAGEVVIGNNVFIGMNTTVLKGVHIGNNVIIGAGSLINKDIPDNVVVVGNPGRVVMSIEDYYQKRKKAQQAEAVELVKNYRAVYGTEPDEQALHEFFWLFENDPQKLPEVWRKQNYLSSMDHQKVDTIFASHKPAFKNKELFLESISKKMDSVI